MDIRKSIDSYNENILKLQFQASEPIEHALTKGELREKFLKRFFADELVELNIKNGILIQGEWQSSQGDFLILKKDARVGSMDLYDANDCQLFMEVKSKVTKSEFIALQEHAKILKEKNSSMLVGMFSYSSEAKRETIFKQFGFAYDKTIKMFEDYDVKLDIYPDIDFYYNLNAERDEFHFIDTGDINDKGIEYSYFLVKDTNGERVYFLQPPVIENLINVFKRTII